MMTRFLYTCFCAVLSAVLAFPAAAIDIKARQYILMDFQTGTVLDSKNADVHMTPSSMAKLLTSYLVFDAVKSGKLSLDDQLTVSRHAWKDGGAASGGSTMFLDPGSKVKVEDLIRGMIIQSGNDACIVLAEGISGSEEAFAEQMNAKAKELGMANSHFTNATGLPDPDQYSTAHDLAILAERIIKDHPEYYSLYSETSFTYNNITQGNRNPLLYRVGSGADGLKTGHTEAGGFGLTASAVRNGRRLILVANGMETMKDRDEETEKLLDYGFREFVNRSLFTAGETVTTADVWLGNAPNVPLVIPKELAIAIPRTSLQSMEVKVVYDNPVPAPIAKGATLGKLIVTAHDLQPIEVPLQAAQDVGRLGLVGRLKAAATYIFLGPPAPTGGSTGPTEGTPATKPPAAPAKAATAPEKTKPPAE
jgi:D-alanyl-D-alanine carboxypeptidase (penicillin-binding protein 5/6)